jgi:hypothetical protein
MALPADPAPDPPYRGESPPALGAPFRRSCQAPPLGTFDTGEFSRRPRGAQHARHLRHQKQFVVERDDARMHRADADRDRFSLPLSAACRFPSHVSFMAAGVCRVIQSSPNASCTARAIKWRSGPSFAQSKAARRHRLDFDKSRSSNSAANVSRILASADSLQKSLRDGDALVPAHSDLRDISSLRIHPRFGVRE